MLFTTSDNFKSNEIEKYFGLIDSHIVIGANLFKDVFASFRDIFGGQTKGYKKEIAKLKKAALDELETKAKKIGANAVIAIKVDLDEISGGAKSMFMYNISGTAIKLKGNYTNAQNDVDIDTLNKEEFEELRQKIKITEKILSNNNIVKDVSTVSRYNYWNEELYSRYCKTFFSDQKQQFEFYDYIKQVPPKYYINRFLENLDTLKSKQFTEILNSLELQNWYDKDLIVRAISDENYIKRFRALKLIIFDRNYYSTDLINDFTEIKQRLKTFNSEIDLIEEEKKLTGTKYYYKCSNCLKKTEYKEKDYCRICDSNIYGFSRNNTISNHYDILDELEIRIKALQTIQSKDQ